MQSGISIYCAVFAFVVGCLPLCSANAINISVIDPATEKYCVELIADNITGQIQYYNINHHSLSTIEFTAELDSVIGNGTCGNSSDGPMDVLHIRFMPNNKDIPDLASEPWSITLRFGRNTDGTFYLYTYDLSAFFGKGANSSSTSTLYEPYASSNTILSKAPNNAFHCATTSLNLGNSAQGTDSNSRLTFVNLKVIANARLNDTNSIYSIPSEECTTSSFTPTALIIVIVALVIFVILNIGVYFYLRRVRNRDIVRVVFQNESMSE